MNPSMHLSDSFRFKKAADHNGKAPAKYKLS